MGFGDLPLNADNIQEMNVIMIVYITISTVVFAFGFNTFVTIREEQKQLRNSAEIMLKHKDLGFIAELDKGDGVREEQFILAVLCHVGVLDFEKNIKPWQEVCKTTHTIPYIITYKMFKLEQSLQCTHTFINRFNTYIHTFSDVFFTSFNFKLEISRLGS